MQKSKSIVVMIIAGGLMLLLLTLTLADMFVAFKEHRPPDPDVIALVASAVSGCVGLLGGYLAGKGTE